MPKETNGPPDPARNSLDAGGRRRFRIPESWWERRTYIVGGLAAFIILLVFWQTVGFGWITWRGILSVAIALLLVLALLGLASRQGKRQYGRKTAIRSLAVLVGIIGVSVLIFRPFDSTVSTAMHDSTLTKRIANNSPSDGGMANVVREEVAEQLKPFKDQFATKKSVEDLNNRVANVEKNINGLGTKIDQGFGEINKKLIEMSFPKVASASPQQAKPKPTKEKKPSVRTERPRQVVKAPKARTQPTPAVRPTRVPAKPLPQVAKKYPIPVSPYVTHALPTVTPTARRPVERTSVPPTQTVSPLEMVSPRSRLSSADETEIVRAGVMSGLIFR